MSPPWERLRSIGRGLRTRLTASPSFRRFAAEFPLTRPIARRQARELFDLCAGFVYSQILLACVRLGLFERLESRSATVTELAAEWAMSPSATRRLLDAAGALELVAWADSETVALGRLGAALIDNPGVVAMIQHHETLYADLSDPVALLRGEVGETQLARFWSYSEAASGTVDAHEAEAYSELMGASHRLVADEVFSAYDLSRHRRVLDVGGGNGSFIAAVARRFPSLALDVFDLPQVAALARERLEAEGLGGRVEVHGGDFKADSLPSGADLITLLRVIHDHNDAAVEGLLAKVRQALAPGGSLLIAEPMADVSGAETIGHAYFGFYLLALGQGRPRTVVELKDLLSTAGFDRIRVLKTRQPVQAGLILAST